MDIDIVNTILRLCNEHQTCLFEVSFLCDYCLENHLCTNSKYVLASIKNYMEIFKISRDQNRIEFFMPFEICRNNLIDGICQNGGELCLNLHVCYDYFYTNSCRRSMNCSYPHILTEKFHENILGSLINLDLDILTKAFRIYCQSKKYLVNHSLLRGQQQQQLNSNLSLINTPTPSSSIINNGRMTAIRQINGNSSWKINNRPVITSKNLSKQEIIIQIPEKGVQICWKPQIDIQTHFIEVVFSNQNKSDGGPIRTHQIYQHLGVAQVFYQNSDIADRVVLCGSVTFQSFTFISRILQRTIDMRHICFSNIPIETNHIELYIDTVSIPYKKTNFQYYQNDKQIIIVEYNEDIDFSKIYTNVRNHPECDGSIINCIQLYQPETLFIEYEQTYSEDDIMKFFNEENIFHIKTYSYCSFVHFYSHHDLIQSMNKTWNNFIRMTPIYIDIYSQRHLNDYLQQRQIEIQSKQKINISSSTVNEIIKKESVSPIENINSICKPQLSIPILPSSSTNQEIEIINNEIPSKQEILSSNSQNQSHNEENQIELNIDNDDNETISSEDDFHDLPSEFDDDNIFLDESIDNSGDMEFLRSAAKNLMSSLAEMEAASANVDTMDAPHSLLYGDDYIVTIKSRRFALAFLDYTQFRVEKQRNPDKFHLLASLKKLANTKKKQLNNIHQREQLSSPISIIETKTNRKKRNKRNKKKKNTSNNNDKDDEIQLVT